MTRVLDFKVRNPEARAMRILLGTTTKSQIMEFCPAANVGVRMKPDFITADDTDIRWCHVPNSITGFQELPEDGAWLVLHDGSFEFLSDTQFHSRYEADE